MHEDLNIAEQAMATCVESGEKGRLAGARNGSSGTGG